MSIMMRLQNEKDACPDLSSVFGELEIDRSEEKIGKFYGDS